MTQHTLAYIHKRRAFCKAEKEPVPETSSRKEKAPEPVPEPPKPIISTDIVSQYIKENMM